MEKNQTQDINAF